MLAPGVLIIVQLAEKAAVSGSLFCKYNGLEVKG
jgi:hypothetical protein